MKRSYKGLCFCFVVHLPENRYKRHKIFDRITANQIWVVLFKFK